MLAERFHMDQSLLRALNPGKALSQADTVIVVANVRGNSGKNSKAGDPPPEKVSRIEVDKKQRELRAYARDNKLVAVYPASIGSAEKPAPSGTHKVTGVVNRTGFSGGS